MIEIQYVFSYMLIDQVIGCILMTFCRHFNAVRWLLGRNSVRNDGLICA
jgi:hypothetical protein